MHVTADKQSEVRSEAAHERGGVGGSERTPRSEQECWSEQKWMGARKRSGDLSGGRKLSGERTGEWTYWTDAAGREEG